MPLSIEEFEAKYGPKFVKPVGLNKIPKSELSKDPIGRIDMVYHKLTDQSFAVPHYLYVALFPELKDKKFVKPEDDVARMLRDDYGLDEIPTGEDEAAVEDSIFSLVPDMEVSEAPATKGSE